MIPPSACPFQRSQGHNLVSQPPTTRCMTVNTSAMTSTVPHVIFQACHARVSLFSTISLLSILVNTDVVVMVGIHSQLSLNSSAGIRMSVVAFCPKLACALHPIGRVCADHPWSAEPMDTISFEKKMIVHRREKDVSISCLHNLAGPVSQSTTQCVSQSSMSCHDGSNGAVNPDQCHGSLRMVHHDDVRIA